ncbi:MAG TPA: hypothetical protein VGM93_01345 [Acidimicrobiales bacterium]
MGDPLADLTRLARERYEGQHGDAHLRVHPGVWDLMRRDVPAKTPEPFGGLFANPFAQLVGLPIVVDDDLPPGDWRLVAIGDGEVRQGGHVTMVIDATPSDGGSLTGPS